MAQFEYIKRGDTNYPILLELIPDPPERLYFKGDINLLKKPAIAVVGSRNSTEYGRWAAFTIAKRLSEHGVCVVSGMASGIDTWAHKGALAEKTPTIAVLGNGLDICYPTANAGLMRAIEKEGLLLSEYPEGTHPSRFTFPQRNRIISGLSYATVVAEAGFSSGSLITAELSVGQGREVYAVPANINRKTSVGCNKLIADGARPLVFIDDILSDLGLKKNPSETLERALGEKEKRIIELLTLHGETSYTLLASLSGIAVAELTSVVTVMEMKGYVRTVAGKVVIS